MRLATIEQSKEIDQLSQKVYGLTGEVLMEAAGAMAARELDQAFFPELKRGLTSIVCGPGNNGGDGLVMARHLHSAGHRDLIVFTYAPKEKRSDLFKIQLERAELQGLKVVDMGEAPEKLDQVRSSSLIVDSLFGIGLTRKVEGEYLKLIDLMNSVKVPVVSLDTPSGLNCNSGMAEGSVVKAAMTLSFGLAKPGFFVADGPCHVGKLRILPIGFPYESLRGVATTHFLFNDRLARRYLPSRKDTDNKYDHGRFLVIAGRDGMWGAGVLASSSAYRMGCGHVTWASFQEPAEGVRQIPEVLTGSLKDKSLLEKDFSAVAVGPGLGVGKDTADVIENLKTHGVKNVVVDADAITTCVQHQLFPLPESWVITPHSGELSRILKMDAKEIDRQRYEAALQGAEATGCHLLLKGYRTVIAYKDRCMVINSGNSALAKAGTGDVLTGMIGAMLAQGLDTLQGTAVAAYIHGRLADEWVRVGNDKSSLSASDLTEHLPQLMGRLAGGSLL